MADGQGSRNRSNTGTVPKIKYSNNAMSRDQPRGPRMSNNLSPSWHVHVDAPNFLHNKSRNQRNKYLAMDVALDGAEISNGVNYAVNGITPISSSSTSRRNSTGSTLKCDNVTKYPDRKQIEDKLSQIREYLEVTSSLMTSIRNSDEQIFDIDEKTNLLQMRNDLLDSEKKLSNLLEEIDASEMASAEPNQSLISNVDGYSEHSNDYTKRPESDYDSYDNTSLRDQPLSMSKLKQKSENRLMDARLIQDKLAAAAHSSNQVNLDSQKSNKNLTIAEFDSAIRDLEERAKRLNQNKPPNEKYTTDKLLSEMQHLQSQIVCMHDANNEREQLIQVLDNRDVELRSQQSELKKRLVELQNKKDQVDQLVMQLQILDEDNQSDAGSQVRNIVTMKDQLNKLKDMLEIVNNTSEHASSAEVQVAANEICLAAENLQNEIAKPSHKRNDSFVENRLDNHVSNETYQKQTNKAQRNQGGSQPKQRASSINEKIALQSELEAKKRELEEIMGKHKAATSNLNHDVRGNPVNDMSWKPPIFSQDQGSNDRLSSDGDENEYSEVQDGASPSFAPQINSYYGSSNRSKCGLDNRSECEIALDRLSLSRTPERNLRGLSVNQSDYGRQQIRVPPNNRNQEKQHKLQKQLELIKSVCDSVLEQIPTNQQSSNNIQQVRNNITPSTVYSEQRVSCPPSPFQPGQNQVNVFQPISEPPPWACQPGGQNDPGNYQSWLATNTLQTQSFMLNTLNQCCQMLWLQQRELAQLRNTVNVLQERSDLQSYAPVPTQPYSQPNPQNQIPNNHLSVPPQKTNQVSAACSMPNLNQYNPISANNDLAFANTSTVPNSALLESCLNNANQLHAVNSNLNQSIPAPIWNGQALNNQVAPGNRANNYWDNFRSYSRQNQLSSKNSEGSIHNMPSGLDRFQLDRINPFPLMTASKSNSENSSTNSRDNTPRKRSFRIPKQTLQNLKTGPDQHAPPPDVLNVNQNVQKPTFDQPESRFSVEFHTDFDKLMDIFNISSAETESASTQERSSQNGTQNQRLKRNKLVDELRENVYKEVASLISANEARPHFLIQLFKDLQKIESDSLRLKILQSVQNILTQSLHCQLTECDSSLPEPVEQPTIWTKPQKHFSSDILNLRLEEDEPFLQNSYKEIVALLELNEEDVIGNHLLNNVKQIFLESELFKHSVKDGVFLKHFSNVLNDVLEQYRGKKVRDVKIHLIQTIGDLLQGELSFIHLIQETLPESCIADERKDSNPTYNNVNSAIFDISSQGLSQSENMQNGDLAEADQSRLDEEIEDEEGAVGGIIESLEDELQIEENLNIDFITSNGEGLDQVPTRLPTKIKSEANTPTKDLLNSEPY